MHSQETDYMSYLCSACLEVSSYSFVNARSLKQRNSNLSKNEKNIKKLNTCVKCGALILDEAECEKKKYFADTSLNQKNINNKNKHFLGIGSVLIILSIILLIFYLFHIYNLKQSSVNIKAKVKELMTKYPNQYPELWQNVLKIVNASKPLVHTFILLYKGDGSVAECFAKDLIGLLNEINNKNRIITYKENNEVTDYGEELTHYMELISKSNHLFIPQLHKIPGNMARMFHFLCDDTPASIRPAYFIFTVKDINNESDKAGHLLARAAQILRSAWDNLKDYELHPLISRVVRNVAVILPESITC